MEKMVKWKNLLNRKIGETGKSVKWKNQLNGKIGSMEKIG